MRAVVVGDDARPVVGGAAGDGVADADAAADSRHQDGAPRQGQGVAADGADRTGGGAGTSGAARSGGDVSVVSVGGHRAKRREVCHMYGDFFFRPGSFHAGGCVRLRAGTVCAYRDGIPVPRRARCPRPRWVVPAGVDCPRPFRGGIEGEGEREEDRGETQTGRRLSARCARARGRRPRGCLARTGRSG